MKTEKYWISGAIAALLICCFVAIFMTQSYGDELNYHYPLAKTITFRKVLDGGSDYSSAYAPLPYFVGNIVLRAWPSLTALRLLNYVVFLLLLWIFFQLARRFSDDPWLLTLLFSLNPYFLLSSVIFYLYNWGPLFALLGLHFYSTKKSFLLSCMFFALAVLSQQWMLVLIAVLMAWEGLRYSKGEIASRILVKRSLTCLLMLLPALFVFYQWGGLVHPNFASHALRPSFEHLSAVISHLGFMMLFPILAGYKEYLQRRLVPLLFTLPLFWLSIPAFANFSDLKHITGFFPHAAMKVERYIHVPYQWTMFAFVIPGLAVLFSILKKREEQDKGYLTYVVLGYFVALVASSRLATAHIYGTMPFMLLLFGKEIAGLKRLKTLMIMQYLGVGIVLLLYFVFIRSKGIEL